jgi:magnesium transporter
MGTALLFNRSHVDEVEDWSAQVRNLGRRSILWIDIDRLDPEEIREVVENLSLSRESAGQFTQVGGSPYFGDFETYLHVTAFVPARRDGRIETVKVHCLVAERWVVTLHEMPVEAFDEFRERACGSGETGRLDGPEFLADLLEWALEAYLAAFETIELALEEFDTRAMSETPIDADEQLRELVLHRQDIGLLRRALVAHRPMFFALTRPELDAITSSAHAERFRELRRQLEMAVAAARDTRESVVGSFDVMLARVGERTNEIVKVLTLGSMLLLPGALIAGVLGMNFRVGFFEDPAYFWVVVAFIVALAAATLAAARARRWI